MSVSKPKYVYVFSRENGDHKIGISDSPRKRTLTARTKTSGPIFLVFSTKREQDARLVEATAHSLLVDKAVGQEWFDVSKNEAIEALQRAIAMIDDGSIEPKQQTSATLKIRVTKAEMELIKAGAKAERRSVSSLLRKAAFDEIERRAR